MQIRNFTRASDKQIEAAGGNADEAQKRMLDWNIDVRHGDGARVALGDFAMVPGAKWHDQISAYSRGLPGGTALDGGEVGASAVRRAVTSSEAVAL
ncbi:MAG TPA: hypothetical protein PKV72_06075, partial [Candidatus Peribacteria bacterium]|nr:hypothetical protein [Candidatus Peribacteria bacterium]